MGNPGLRPTLLSSQLREKHLDVCKKITSVFRGAIFLLLMLFNGMCQGSEEGLCWHLEHVLRNGNTVRIVRLAPEARSLEGIAYLHDSGVFSKQNSPTVLLPQFSKSEV